MQKQRAANAASSHHHPREEDDEDADADGEFEEEDDQAIVISSSAGAHSYHPNSRVVDMRHHEHQSASGLHHPPSTDHQHGPHSPPAPRMIASAYPSPASAARLQHPSTTPRRRADSYSHRPPPRGPPSPRRPDLASAAGRRAFVHTSAAHLFRTTYDPEEKDVLTVSSLLTYINAALPPDRCEEFDTSEVARALHGLEGGGESRGVALEGDVIRWLM